MPPNSASPLAAPFPWSFGAAELLLGSAWWGSPLPPGVICLWAALGGGLYPRASSTSLLPTYLFPFGGASRGAGEGPGFKSASSVLFVSV